MCSANSCDSSAIENPFAFSLATAMAGERRPILLGSELYPIFRLL